MPFDVVPTVNVAYQKSPGGMEAGHLTAPEGSTVLQILSLCEIDLRLALPVVQFVKNGEIWVVPFDMWGKVRPKAGTRVEAYFSFRDPVTAGAIGSALLTANAGAIASAMFTVSAGTFAYVAATAAVSIVGTLLINALIPPAKQDSDGGIKNYAITGTQNQENPFGIYPKVIGRRRIFPPKTSTGFTETVDDDIYFRGRYAAGYGRPTLEDIRIGTKPITDFDDVEIEFLNVHKSSTLAAHDGLDAITVGWRYDDALMTLCPDDITEDTYNVKLEENDPVTQVTRPDSESASVDVSWPQGIYSQPTTKRYGRDIELKYRYRLLGSGEAGWSDFIVEERRGKSTSLLRWTKNIRFPSPGEYEVEVRVDADKDSDDVGDPYLTAVRSFASGKLPSHENVAEVAIRIRGSDQLNGEVDSLNFIVQQRAPIWDGNGWTSNQPIRHPAWAYLDALRGPHLARPVPDNRIDLDAIKAWADEEPHWTCDYVVDSPSTVRDVLDVIASTGRAHRALTDFKYSVIRDGAKGSARQVFTPRNSWGFQGKVVFPREIHGLRCKIISERQEWGEDEVIVYADGYDASNATIFETLDLPGLVIGKDDEDEGNVYRLARYHLAVAKLRPEEFEFHADWEHLAVMRGDKVQVVHDVPAIGMGVARVRSFTLNQGLLDTIEMDDVLDFNSQRLRLNIRTNSGVIQTIEADSPASAFDRVWTVVGDEDGSIIEEGNLVTIEKRQIQTFEGLVKGIYPSSDESAKVVLVPASPAVLDADTGTIPPYDPLVTNPPQPASYGPPFPTVLNAFSDNTTLIRRRGVPPAPSIGVTFELKGRKSAKMQIRWAPVGGSWEYGELVSSATPVIQTGPLFRDEYYVAEIRSVGGAGRSRGWVRAGTIPIGNADAPDGPNTTGTSNPLSVTLDGGPLGEDVEYREVWVTFAGGPDMRIATTREPTYTFVPPPSATGYYLVDVNYDDISGGAGNVVVLDPRGVGSGDLDSDLAQDIQNSLDIADQALTDAGEAQNTANGIVTNFQSSYTDISGQYQALDDIKSSIDSVGNDLSGFQTAVSQTYATQAGLAGLETRLSSQTAGSNLIQNDWSEGVGNVYSGLDSPLSTALSQSGPYSGRYFIQADAAPEPNSDVASMRFPVAGEPTNTKVQVRASVYLNTSAGSPDLDLSARFENHDGSYSNFVTSAQTVAVGSWYEISHTFDCPEDKRLESIRVQLGNAGVNADVRVAWIEALDVRASEDVRADINATITQDYYVKSDVDDAIALAKQELTASITQLNGDLPGYGVNFDNDLDAEGDPIPSSYDHPIYSAGYMTLLEGGPALGQTNSIIIREPSGTSRSTSNVPNGASIEIPTSQALQFVGNRVKMSVLAKKPSSNAASKFGVAYSTADTGNSGYLQSDNLSDEWQWFSFYFDVPEPSVGGGETDYFAIYGDDAQNNKGTQVAKVVLERAAEAGELPEISTLQSQVTTLQGAQADVDGFLQAYAGLTVSTNGGNVAGFYATSYSNPNGSGSALQLLGDDVMVPGSLTATSLAIGDFTNYADDGTFETDNFPFRIPPDEHPEIVWAYGEVIYGTRSLRMDPGGPINDLKKPINVIPGERIYYEFWAQTDDGFDGGQADGGGGAKLRFKAQDGAFLHHCWYNPTTGGMPWTFRSGSFTVPAGVNQVIPQLWNNDTWTTSKVNIDQLKIVKQVPGVLIEDGAITGDKMVANAVTAREIKAGEVNSDHIETDSLTLNLFANGQLQTALLPIAIDIITNSQSNWSPRYSGLVQIWCIGGGGSGGVSQENNDECLATGGGGGGVGYNFIPNAGTNDTYNMVIGSGGNPVAVDDRNQKKNGNTGGTTKVVGPGINLQAQGGEGGQGALRNDNPVQGGSGGACSGGIVNRWGGNGGNTNTVANDPEDKRATGGGACRYDSDAVNNGSQGNFYTPGDGGHGVKTNYPNIELTGILFKDYGNWDGGRGNMYFYDYDDNTRTSYGEDGGIGGGGGGAITTNSPDNSGYTESGAGGDGIVFVVYYGQGNLK